MKFDFEPIPLPHRQALSDEEARGNVQEYYEFIRKRHTVRDFSDKPVPKDIIESCILAAGTAPSGANHQPWHFVCINDQTTKKKIREAAEKEEAEFYGGKGGDAWLSDLKKMGTDASKPFLETAPWLIAIFAERFAINESGERQKNYYISESAGIATGFLINALHRAGLETLTHTPNPMKFLNTILERPSNERPFILLVVGHASQDACIPGASTEKKPLSKIASFFE